MQNYRFQPRGERVLASKANGFNGAYGKGGGIELKTPLKMRKLLILLNAETAKNAEFAEVRYSVGAGTDPAVQNGGSGQV